MGSFKHYLKVLFFYIPILSWRFSCHYKIDVLVKLLQLLWFVVSRKTLLLSRKFELSICFNDQKVTIPLYEPADISVLGEVFVAREYDWEVPFEVEHILDLGAHWGDSSLYYLLSYPQAQVYAVEPAPYAFARLKQWEEKFEHLHTLQGAFGLSDGEAPLYVSKNTLGNSVFEREWDAVEEMVNVYSMHGIATKFGVQEFSLVKFDIEGAEKFIFSDMSIKKIARGFIGEIHLDLMNVTLDEIKDYFSDFDCTFEEINKKRYIVKAIRGSDDK